jgi:RNA polymerase sigma-70 factor (ECF subfamily)
MSVDFPNTSLAEVFIAHRRQLQGLARKIVGTIELAEDVVQDAYLKIFQGVCASHVDKPYGYCCQVVRNMALDHYRRQSVESAYRIYSDDGELPQVPGGVMPERAIDDRRKLEVIDRALDTLPGRTRRAFEFYRLAGLTQREIGQRLGCSATLVNFMIKDAMLALASCRSLLEE